MFIRLSTVTRNGKKYAYAQLVESYRREGDGVPAHRVIANLGSPDSLEVQNLRVAIDAAKTGKRVHAFVPLRTAKPIVRPAANLRYLDVAVLLELWREWGLDELLEDLLPRGESEAPPARIVAALTLQRCVDPGSKLYAARWFPRTALPELLALSPANFNNTRIHRVLDAIDDATPMLMRKLPHRFAERDGAFAALFLDVTDAWFVGDGPLLAERGKTKEGLIQRKIGIVLLCNAHGYPLRWEVIPGARADATAMTDLVRSLSGVRWIGDALVVCDRAMGKTAQILDLLATGLRFLTALTVTEFDGYSGAIPHQPFASFQLHQASRRAEDVEEASRCAERAGMKKIEDDLFVLDLGIVERSVGNESTAASSTAEVPAAHAVRLCREMKQGVADGRFSSLMGAGRDLGLGKSLVKKYCQLARLSEEIQRAVLDGGATGLSLVRLIEIARLQPGDQQREAFDAFMKAAPRPGATNRPAAVDATKASDELKSIRVRAVAYFNPDRFVEQRQSAQHHAEEIRAFIADLNVALASPRARRTRDSIAAAIDRKLRSYDLVSAFRIEISERSVGRTSFFHVEAQLDEAAWARRRRYDGFSVLVAHPDVPQSAAELCRLYRAKDAVEKDFEIIKSVVQLRPIRHRTDDKVRAHVTLCMLALLLERTLRRKLEGKQSAKAALELLATCHLNYYPGADGDAAYVLTRTDQEQDKLLRVLRLQHLGDDGETRERITPR